MATLAERIKEAREDRDLSQSELGVRLGISQSLVSMWERGEKEPDPDQIKTLDRKSVV